MKKLIIGLSILILVVLWQSISIYHQINMERQTKAQKAIQSAQNQFKIKKVLNTDEFRGSSAFEVIQATLTNGTKMWIWMPENGKGTPFTARVAEGYTKNEIVKAFKQKVPYKSLISTKLGMVNHQPAWEMTYIDLSGATVFSYFDFYSGKSVMNPIALK